MATKSILSRKVGILALSTLSMISLTTSPSYAAIAQAFHAGNTFVQMLTSIPNLAALIAGLVIGRLAAGRMPHKYLAITGVALICLGGLAPLVYHASLSFLLVCSAVIGFGQGMVTNIVQVLITEELPENQRQDVMGKNTAFTNFGAMLVIFAGGVLAAKSWVNNYLAYLFPVLILIIVLIALPLHKSEAVENVQTKNSPVEKTKISVNKFTWLIALGGFCSMVLYNVFSNNISLFVTAHHLGGSALAGGLSMIGLLGGLLCGIIVGSLAKVLKNYTISSSFLLMALSFLIIGFANSMIMIGVGSFLSGAALSLCMAQYPYLISISADKTSVPMSIGVYSAGLAIGGFASPFLMNILAGSDTSALNIFTTSGLASLVLCILIAAIGLQRKIVEQAFGQSGKTENA
ncbi:MFS transporter [Levilactobacillus fujinensis]|uniref:MFS transporter n=1 Tax=Levilactobacillus fujinensis TaxID=2486024 RepID=A0ABW1THZ6_9LACO|nr:MFS transporter [Levilactobacillus fujinensis]